jgi:hypothetical protein
MRELRSGKPNDRAGRTPLDIARLRERDPVIVNHSNATGDADQSFSRILHAFAACGACYPALFENFVAGEKASALHQEIRVDRTKHEERFGACFDAVPTRGAFLQVHSRQAGFSHPDCAERARALAVGEAQTSP